MKHKITPAVARFLRGEIANERDGGEAPATLSTAADSLVQGGPDVFGLDVDDVTSFNGLCGKLTGDTGLRELFDDQVNVPADYQLVHDKDYHRVQVNGNDLVSIQEHGDGTAFVIVYAGTHEHSGVAWQGIVDTLSATEA